MSKEIKRPLKEMEKIAEEFANTFLESKFEIAGSIRRRSPQVGDIDILTKDDLKLVQTKLGESFLDGDTKKMNARFKGVKFNLYHAEENYWGAMLMFLTGPQQYNIGYRVKAKVKGMKLNQYGLFELKSGKCLASKTEEEIFAALEKPFKDPTERGK